MGPKRKAPGPPKTVRPPAKKARGAPSSSTKNTAAKPPAKTDSSKKRVIPESVEEWMEFARREGVQRTSINQLTDLKSGSKITDKQFLALRVIWPEMEEADSLSIPNRKEAEMALKKMNPYWKRYTNHVESVTIENPTAPSIHLGPFQSTRCKQQKVENILPKVPSEPAESRDTSPSESHRVRASRSRSTSVMTAVPAARDDPDEEWTKTRDEQIVNDALLSFLDPLMLNTPGSKCLWSLERLRFVFNFKAAKMEARTDGYLGECNKVDTNEAFAILETKASTRDRAVPYHGVFKQESAENALWIVYDSENKRDHQLPTLQGPGKHQRLLIAQDRHEIYVVIGSYDDDYVNYLKGKNASSASFMVMQEYGPFSIHHSTHMERLAKFVVGFCLDVSKKIQESDSMSQTPS